jgi:three-Cys-motif partner protein
MQGIFGPPSFTMPAQQPPEWEELQLFQPPPPSPTANPPKEPSAPVWTENKAQLIKHYLVHFVQVTRHGTYIDGFAGPQQPDLPQMWAANLVLEAWTKEPWLRHYHLFERDPAKVARLVELGKQHPERDVHVYQGDFNQRVGEVLRPDILPLTEAAFCLVDQHTFECRWATLETLARYKRDAYRIELFYFLANSWFVRALDATKDPDRIRAWWGGNDWPRLRDMSGMIRAFLLAERFQKELGYNWASPFAIHERDGHGQVMYYMIHATDHPEATKLMSRAYNEAVTATPLGHQLSFGGIGP